MIPSKDERQRAVEEWKANRAERRARIRAQREAEGRWIPAYQHIEETERRREG